MKVSQNVGERKSKENNLRSVQSLGTRWLLPFLTCSLVSVARWGMSDEKLWSGRTELKQKRFSHRGKAHKFMQRVKNGEWKKLCGKNQQTIFCASLLFYASQFAIYFIAEIDKADSYVATMGWEDGEEFMMMDHRADAIYNSNSSSDGFNFVLIRRHGDAGSRAMSLNWNEIKVGNHKDVMTWRKLSGEWRVWKDFLSPKTIRLSWKSRGREALRRSQHMAEDNTFNKFKSNAL